MLLTPSVLAEKSHGLDHAMVFHNHTTHAFHQPCITHAWGTIAFHQPTTAIVT